MHDSGGKGGKGGKGRKGGKRAPARAFDPFRLFRLLVAFCLASTTGTAQQTSRFSGTLVRRDSTPVEAARVRLPRVDRMAVTDRNGHFVFSDLLPGRYEVSILVLGLPPVSMDVVLAPGESYHSRIVLSDEPQRLGDITVTEAARPTATEQRLEAFERRRQRGLGVFLTAEHIARRNPRVLSDALVNINGTLLMERGAGKVLISARGSVPQQLQGGKVASPCMLRLMVDGQAMPAGTSVDEVKPEDVAGIEIYPGAASLPVELAHFQEDTWCGAVVIWTKGG